MGQVLQSLTGLLSFPEPATHCHRSVCNLPSVSAIMSIEAVPLLTTFRTFQSRLLQMKKVPGCIQDPSATVAETHVRGCASSKLSGADR